MRWLMIGLLVSLVALLLAAAGMARHILLHRASLRSESQAPHEFAPASDREIEP